MKYNGDDGGQHPPNSEPPINLTLAEAIAKIRRLQNVIALQTSLPSQLIEGVMELLERVAMMSEDRTNSYARKAALSARADNRRVVSEPTIHRWAKIAEQIGVLFVDRRALRFGGRTTNHWQIRWDVVDKLIAPQLVDSSTSISSRQGYHGATPRGITARPPTKGRLPRKKNKTDRDQPPVNLSSVDWDRVRWDFERLRRKIPPKTAEDRRAFLRYVVLSHTACSADWLADSIEAVVNSKEPSRNAVARFVSILLNKVEEHKRMTKAEFLALAEQVEIPDDIWRETGANCSSPMRATPNAPIL